MLSKYEADILGPNHPEGSKAVCGNMSKEDNVKISFYANDNKGGARKATELKLTVTPQPPNTTNHSHKEEEQPKRHFPDHHSGKAG